LIDQTDLPSGVGGANEAFTLPAGRGDEARHPGGLDPPDDIPIKKVRDIYIPDLHTDALAVKARSLR
jgi:error-prone DNA polymerase